MNGQLRQGFAVQLDSGFIQAGDKSAVGHAMLAAGGVNANNPQFAEFALFRSPVAVSELAGPVGRLLGVPVESAGISEVSLGGAQGTLATLAGCGMILCFRHVSFFVFGWLPGRQMSPGRAALLSLELVRATDLDELGHTVRAAAVLSHAALLLNSLVTQEVALAGRTAQYLAGTGHLELLSNGFACFDHWKREERKEPGVPCKAYSINRFRKKRPDDESGRPGKCVYGQSECRVEEVISLPATAIVAQEQTAPCTFGVNPAEGRAVEPEYILFGNSLIEIHPSV